MAIAWKSARRVLIGRDRAKKDFENWAGRKARIHLDRSGAQAKKRFAAC